MKYLNPLFIFLLSMLMLALSSDSQVIFDFNKDSNLKNWSIQDDVVMGGRSSGHFELTDEGHGHFYGNVSLENNGGFSQVRYLGADITNSPTSRVMIRLKGDGKRYQFRVKPDNQQRYNYISYFETSGKWETISIPLSSLRPVFRGRALNRPNYNHSSIREIAFLIGNNKEQRFNLYIDSIHLSPPDSSP